MGIAIPTTTFTADIPVPPWLKMFHVLAFEKATHRTPRGHHRQSNCIDFNDFADLTEEVHLNPHSSLVYCERQ